MKIINLGNGAYLRHFLPNGTVIETKDKFYALRGESVKQVFDLCNGLLENYPNATVEEV